MRAIIWRNILHINMDSPPPLAFTQVLNTEKSTQLMRILHFHTEPYRLTPFLKRALEMVVNGAWSENLYWACMVRAHTVDLLAEPNYTHGEVVCTAKQMYKHLEGCDGFELRKSGYHSFLDFCRSGQVLDFVPQTSCKSVAKKLGRNCRSVIYNRAFTT